MEYLVRIDVSRLFGLKVSGGERRRYGIGSRGAYILATLQDVKRIMSSRKRKLIKTNSFSRGFFLAFPKGPLEQVQFICKSPIGNIEKSLFLLRDRRPLYKIVDRSASNVMQEAPGASASSGSQRWKTFGFRNV